VNAELLTTEGAAFPTPVQAGRGEALRIIVLPCSKTNATRATSCSWTILLRGGRRKGPRCFGLGGPCTQAI
jgi:hypothetical protein